MKCIPLAAAFVLVAFVGVGIGQTFADLCVRFPDRAVASAAANSTVGRQVFLQQLTPAPAGGPQALEGYTQIAHDRGNVALAFGTIGNVEMNARGTVSTIRSMQAGGVVTNDGRVTQWSGLAISQPRAKSDYHGPVNIDRYDYVTFDNGWSIRPDGDRLLFCNPAGQCRSLF